MTSDPPGAPGRNSGVDEVSDDALLAGLATGLPEPSAAFVRRFQHRVYGLALTVLGDRSLAEDAAQEAFVRAWRHADTYDARRGPVAAWLLTITRNVAIDALRAQHARPTDWIDTVLVRLAGDSPDLGPGPADAALQQDESRRAVRALAALPLPQRRAVVLAAYGGRSAREVSEHEAVPLGTAKSRIRAGLQGLRARLTEGTGVDR